MFQGTLTAVFLPMAKAPSREFNSEERAVLHERSGWRPFGKLRPRLGRSSAPKRTHETELRELLGDVLFPRPQFERGTLIWARVAALGREPDEASDVPLVREHG